MTYYRALGITSGEIGGAIADAIVHDIRVNNLALRGFPQITVLSNNDRIFQIAVGFGGVEAYLSLSDEEAKRICKTMKAGHSQDAGIFDRVQRAVAELEGKRHSPP